MRRFILLILVIPAFLAAASAQDLPGSKDHELATRFPASRIIRFDERKYDEYRFISRKMELLENLATNNSTRKEGEYAEIVYETPSERFQNME